MQRVALLRVLVTAFSAAALLFLSLRESNPQEIGADEAMDDYQAGLNDGRSAGFDAGNQATTADIAAQREAEEEAAMESEDEGGGC